MKNLKNAVLTALMIFSLTSNVSAIFGSKKKGDTELHTAVRNKNLNEVVGILIQNQGLVNSQNNAGDTPLHVVCGQFTMRLRSGDWEKLEKIFITLLKYGARLDIKNNKKDIAVDTFLRADALNGKYLSVPPALLIYFYDDFICAESYLSYYYKMQGFFDEMNDKYGSALVHSNLKEMFEDRLSKRVETSLAEIESYRKKYIF